MTDKLELGEKYIIDFKIRERHAGSLYYLGRENGRKDSNHLFADRIDRVTILSYCLTDSEIELNEDHITVDKPCKTEICISGDEKYSELTKKLAYFEA